MPRYLKFTALILPLVAAAAISSWWLYVSPHVYKTATSPDGSWSVTVFRQRNNAYPLMEGVDVTVAVTDPTGRSLFRKTIDNRDLWTDVELQYRDVICNNDEILIGPDYWDGTKSAYFKLTKRDVR